MPTKILKFDDDVLEIIRSMEWSDDGLLGVLTCGQLERKMYQKVNKALDAMGGKWNRKTGGHVFRIDPRPQVEGLLDDGNLTIERDGFFETPDAVIDRMLELVPLDEGFILEPSAGLGAIARRLRGNITLVEKNPQRCEKLRETFRRVLNMDFLEYVPLEFEQHKSFDLIYMNPPFEELQDIDHVMHAYDLLYAGGRMVSVMGEGAFFRQDKKSTAFREWLDSVSGVSERLPDGSFRVSGTGVNARLVVIGK